MSEDFPAPLGPKRTLRQGPGLKETDVYCMKLVKLNLTMVPGVWKPESENDTSKFVAILMSCIFFVWFVRLRNMYATISNSILKSSLILQGQYLWNCYNQPHNSLYFLSHCITMLLLTHQNSKWEKRNFWRKNVCFLNFIWFPARQLWPSRSL